MEFAEFATRAAAVESVSADTDTVGFVAELFADAGEDLAVVTRFVRGRVFPAHEPTTLDIGPALCYEALARAARPNVAAADVEAKLAEIGEIGAVAEELDLGGQRGLASFGDGDDGLTVAGVDAELRALAGAEGVGSTDTKVETLFGLFNRAGPTEARFLARLVLGNMRIGVGEGAVRDATAAAFDVPSEAVERAMQVSNDAGLVAETARSEGEPGLGDVRLAVGRPVEAMLAQAGSAVDAIEAWGSVAVEPKFDGARVQLHYDGVETRLFSRNLEEVTDALPEVVETVAAALDRPAILDGEVVAVDEDGSPRPFQDVLRRFRRKHDVAAAREAVPVEFYAFDCLHADGDDLLDAPLLERRERLSALLGGDDADPGGVADVRIAESVEEIAAREEAALAAGHEGIMLKNPESAYTPGDRGRNWLKRKPDVETLDLVVTGAEWGEGRRANHFGTFLLSIRDGEAFEPIGKVATGITDEELERLHERLVSHVRSESGTDVEIDPAVVFEVGYEEIQRSPTYGSGYALRFPRFVAVREDKSPEDADSLERVERLAR
ncbi:DNA ligase (ATP) [Natronomonas moolapensis 8.8.11]|uniref:DNA ligase n=1 Tax=Natronomonas moolapensis (strain DSM 18674 / CECT 7526 / JCM 14361 / 8.8.11) TaxID=268739 RepID=M1XRX6_NATM8|nr:ATP-dependent DNA ligase LigA [Natronomonas moolapensis]CCQ37017.1 DNA ligase (ATP) [Natronomonas moolapensis 8.8.11]